MSFLLCFSISINKPSIPILCKHSSSHDEGMADNFRMNVFPISLLNLERRRRPSNVQSPDEISSKKIPSIGKPTSAC